MVKPQAKRALVTYTRKRYKLSARRACGLFGLNESTWYYHPKERDDGPLRKALNQHASANPGWGYRGLMDWLIRDGFTGNHKRVYRVYTEEGLQLGQRKRRQKSRYRGSKTDEPAELNALWTMDFLSDQLMDGRVVRLLAVMDVYSRRCLALEADTSIGGGRVARVLVRCGTGRTKFSVEPQRVTPKVA